MANGLFDFIGGVGSTALSATRLGSNIERNKLRRLQQDLAQLKTIEQKIDMVAKLAKLDPAAAQAATQFLQESEPEIAKLAQSLGGRPPAQREGFAPGRIDPGERPSLLPVKPVDTGEDITKEKTDALIGRVGKVRKELEGAPEGVESEILQKILGNTNEELARRGGFEVAKESVLETGIFGRIKNRLGPAETRTSLVPVDQQQGPLDQVRQPAEQPKRSIRQRLRGGIGLDEDEDLSQRPIFDFQTQKGTTTAVEAPLTEATAVSLADLVADEEKPTAERQVQAKLDKAIPGRPRQARIAKKYGGEVLDAITQLNVQDRAKILRMIDGNAPKQTVLRALGL